MSYDNNPYYRPKEMGLEILFTLDEPDMSYEYNTLVVWKHIKTGKLYYASDSGCSCPIPFEQYSTLDSLTKLTRANLNNFIAEVEEFGYTETRPLMQDDKRKLIKLVKEELK